MSAILLGFFIISYEQWQIGNDWCYTFHSYSLY
jgi:hypothetical protein